MKVLTKEELILSLVHSFGDGRDSSIFSPVVLSNLARRAAGFCCPCSIRTLVNAVVRPLSFIEEDDLIANTIIDMIESMVSHGDIIECSLDDADKSSKLLYLAPPSFVRFDNGTILLLGLAPDGKIPLSDELVKLVEYRDHLRLLRDANDLCEDLRALGLIELKPSAWMKAPTQELPAAFLAKMNSLLGKSTNPGEIQGLQILDPSKPVRFYKGRWDTASRQSGKFIGRRPRAYGNDLWCYVQLLDGRPVHLVDLPASISTARGCDEAWRLQAAIDHERGTPQVFSVEKQEAGRSLIKFYSPVPMWAHRRWAAIGSSGCAKCLFSYSFSDSTIEQEKSFIREWLWHAELNS